MKILLTLSLFFSSLLVPLVARADSVHGLTLTPATRQVVIASGSGQTTLLFQVGNATAEPQSLTFRLTDFSAGGQNNGAVQLNTDATNRYGLTHWASLDQYGVMLQPGQSQTVTVRINDDNSLLAGGHYGALVVTARDSQSSGSGHYVFLNQAINGLIFLTKTGGEVYGLNLSSVESAGSLLGQSPILSMHFQNTGNVHTVPRGIAKVYDPHGRLISQGVINSNSDLIFPQSYRLEQTKLLSVSSANMIGRYRLNIQYHRDGDDNVTSSSVFFFYSPPYIVVLVILLLVSIPALLLLRRRRFTRRM